MVSRSRGSPSTSAIPRSGTRHARCCGSVCRRGGCRPSRILSRRAVCALRSIRKRRTAWRDLGAQLEAVHRRQVDATRAAARSTSSTRRPRRWSRGRRTATRADLERAIARRAARLRRGPWPRTTPHGSRPGASSGWSAALEKRKEEIRELLVTTAAARVRRPPDPARPAVPAARRTTPSWRARTTSKRCCRWW